MFNLTSKVPLQLLCMDEDSDFLAYLLSSAEPFNLIIHTVTTIEAAHEKMRSFPYNGYIINLNQPDGVGLDLLEEIKKQNDRTPLAVISSLYRDAFSFRLLKEKYKVDFALNKPIYPEQIENLLSNICQHTMLASSSTLFDKLQDIKRDYDKSICDKIDLLSEHIKQVQLNPSKETLTALRDLLHSIGNGAREYGYPQVSSCCEELEFDINVKLSIEMVPEKEWLMHLEAFLRNIKFHYQVTSTSHAEPLYDHAHFAGSRSSLFVVDSDLQFLELIKKNGERFAIDLYCESDPHAAIKRLKAPDFNPRAIIVSQKFPSPVNGYDIVAAAKRKDNQLPTIYCILLDEDTLDTRIEAVERGIKYVFHKPISSHVLLQSMAKVLDIDFKKTYKVLVVDDDPEVCQYIAYTLGKIGVDVRILHDPSNLLPTIEEYAPHMLLLDLILPKYGGHNLLKVLRADFAYSNLIIAIITARNDPVTVNMAFADHADEILFKPLDRLILQKRVINLLKRHAYSGTLFLTKEWVGLEPLSALLKNLHDTLQKSQCPNQFVALFEIDGFSNLIFQKGHSAVNNMLISISNMLLSMADKEMSFFFYNTARFAIVFEDDHTKDVVAKIRHLLHTARHSAGIDISFSCGIVPISGKIGNEYDILIAAEKILEEAQHSAASSIKVVVLGNVD